MWDLMAIIDLLKNKNYIIVLDTNVFLNIYRFSPEFSVFALECLKTVKKKIFLPSTVQLEFYKHNNTEFAKMKNRVVSAGYATKTKIQQAKQKILTSCMNFDRLKFPDIDELKSFVLLSNSFLNLPSHNAIFNSPYFFLPLFFLL